MLPPHSDELWEWFTERIITEDVPEWELLRSGRKNEPEKSIPSRIEVTFLGPRTMSNTDLSAVCDVNFDVRPATTEVAGSVLMSEAVAAL
jgi:hypothetical protein